MPRMLAMLLVLVTFGLPLSAQNINTISGKVQDATGALLPGAHVALIHDHATVAETTSGSDGSFMFHPASSGSFGLQVTAAGFAEYRISGLPPGKGTTKLIVVTLHAAAEAQVTVSAEKSEVSLDPDENSNTTVLKGADLKALSDDPEMLRTQLQALAGPAAGTGGGQVYIDGYTGGQLPPKNSILEIHVNQNPFLS